MTVGNADEEIRKQMTGFSELLAFYAAENQGVMYNAERERERDLRCVCLTERRKKKICGKVEVV